MKKELASNFLDIIPIMEYDFTMWEVEYTDEFGKWWDTLTLEEQGAVTTTVTALESAGPSLPFPYCSSVQTSKHKQMRELRSQCSGRPIRTFYAFDTKRAAILLIGGDKTGNDRFYEEYVPVADRIFEDYLNEMDKE
ncbi:toxin RelE [Spirochaetia bacterium]|nr:toxin RelE [Spirochaetia bacterium]